MTDFDLILVFSGSLSLLLLVSLVLVYHFHDWIVRRQEKWLALSGGILLGIAFLDYAMESTETCQQTPVLILLGFLTFLVLEFVVSRWVCDAPCDRCQNQLACPRLTQGLLLFNNAYEGVFIAASFQLNVQLGLRTSLGILLHEIPESSVLILLLLHSGQKFQKNMDMILFSLLLIPISAVLAHDLLQDITPQTLSAGLAFAAGMFLYVSMPIVNDTVRSKDVSRLCHFLGGIVLITLLRFI